MTVKENDYIFKNYKGSGNNKATVSLQMLTFFVVFVVVVIFDYIVSSFSLRSLKITFENVC